MGFNAVSIAILMIESAAPGPYDAKRAIRVVENGVGSDRRDTSKSVVGSRGYAMVDNGWQWVF